MMCLYICERTCVCVCQSCILYAFVMIRCHSKLANETNWAFEYLSKRHTMNRTKPNTICFFNMKIKKWNGQREFFIQFDLYDKRKWELKCRNESKKKHSASTCKHIHTRDERERVKQNGRKKKQMNKNKKNCYYIGLNFRSVSPVENLFYWIIIIIKIIIVITSVPLSFSLCLSIPSSRNIFFASKGLVCAFTLLLAKWSFHCSMLTVNRTMLCLCIFSIFIFSVKKAIRSFFFLCGVK